MYTATAAGTDAIRTLVRRFTDEVLNGHDLDGALTELVVEEDRVATVSFWTGTHRGEFMGIPPTGRTVRVEAWTLDRYQDGQLAESRIIMDVVGLLAQLGAVPAPAA
jgi:predicted ester cyclase